MKRFVRSLVPMAVVAVVTHVVMFLVLNDILLTLSFAIAGERWAALPYQLLVLGVQIGAVLVVWRVRKPRDSEARRLYLNELGAEPYSRKADRRCVSHDRTYRAELLAYAVTVFVQFTVEFNILSAILFSPIAYGVFHVYNRRLWLNLHETWAAERIRLNPNGGENPTA